VFYKEYAAYDSSSREKAKKLVSGRRQRSYGGLLDASKFSLKGSESPPTRRGMQLSWSNTKVKEIAAVAEEPSPPPDELYTKEVDLEDIPTLQQQLKDPVYQPVNSSDLWPRQLSLTGKKLHRCKGCDHILMKAEMNLSSIRFKIQQTALHTFPRVRIAEFPSLSVGTPNDVVLSITNPLNYGVTVSFSQCSPEQLEHIKETLVPVTVPEGKFYLTPNDDVVDLLEEEAESEIKDDPMFVSHRLPGKLFLKFKVTPEAMTEKVIFMFAMEFSHKPTVEADKENEMIVVNVPVLVRLGKPTV
jgi:dynactin-4